MSGHTSSGHGPLQHHFTNLKQQYEAVSLGMWTFLVTEILTFGALFMAYTVNRGFYYAAFAAGSRHLNLWLGGTNTIVLLVSSFTMGLAVRTARFGKKDLTSIFLSITLVLGLLFLGIKSIEYHDKFLHHLVPTDTFHFHGFEGPGIRIFYSLYFVLTGIHALHMIVGVIILAIILWQNKKGCYTTEYSTPVTIFGLYWHFIDIVWTFLFPLLYLIGRHA